MRLGATLLAFVGALAAGACTDVDLYRFGSVGILERQRIVADVCAPRSAEEDVPYKILFVIDTSLSNNWNDDTSRREGAVRRAISEYLDRETVSFGIITFSDEPRLQTFGFTRDVNVLDGATENVDNAQGGTNYSDTLWAVIDFVLRDVATLSMVEAARTHYLIYLLSDGIPTVGVTEPLALLPSVRYLMDQLRDRVAELRWNTAYLGAVPDIPVQQADEARQLLLDMATEGDGSFMDIPSGADFSFTIHADPTALRLRLALVAASNRHARFAPEEPIPDSDGDWVSDEEEDRLGLNPISPDSDGDGYRDGVELATTTTAGPLEFDEDCPSPTLDSDDDGLGDCEERALGTVPFNPDTDGDLLLDSLEASLRSSTVANEPVFDGDLDGFTDHEEVRYHLDPLVANDHEDLERWGYRYEVRRREEGDGDSPTCYQVAVDNLALVETRADDTHPRGGNVIDLVAAFSGEGGGGPVWFQHVELRGRLVRSADYYDPPHGQMFVAPTDFRLLGAGPAGRRTTLYEQPFTGDIGTDPEGWSDPDAVWDIASVDGETGVEYRNDWSASRVGAALFNVEDNAEGWSTVSDYEVSAEVRHRTGPSSAFGIMGRVADTMTFYELGLVTEAGGMAHARLRKSMGAAPVDLADQVDSPFEMVSGRRIYLKLAFEGNRVTGMVDNTSDFRSPLVVHTLVDEEPIPAGGVGVKVSVGTSVVFDDLLVTAAEP